MVSIINSVTCLKKSTELFFNSSTDFVSNLFTLTNHLKFLVLVVDV